MPARTPAPPERRAHRFLGELTKDLAPLERGARLAQWEAMTGGGDAAYSRYTDRMIAFRRVLAAPGRLEACRRHLDAVQEPSLRRRLEVVLLLLASHRMKAGVAAGITAEQARLEQLFSLHRGIVEGKALSAGEVSTILRSHRGRGLRRQAWEAQKSVGAVVAPGLVALMEGRNRVAQAAGASDWWEHQIRLLELVPAELLGLLDRLGAATDVPFQAAKATIDAAVAEDLGVAAGTLMPWDYPDPFFQEVPHQALSGLGSPAVADPVAAARDGCAHLGFDLEPVLAASSLHEAPGKNPHALTSDIDRSGDVRILANVRPTLSCFVTLLHESGHALYARGISRALPWELRREAHSLVTEGVALLFESLADDAALLHRFAGLPAGAAEGLAAARRQARRLGLLVFSRWCQVMVRFEAAAYRDPRQDLDGLWWSLVERWQGIGRPPGRRAPDWASKIHLSLFPVYYQNYLLGQLFAWQLRTALEGEPGLEWHRRPEVARHLSEELFAHGASRAWPEAVRLLTGAALGPGALCDALRCSGRDAAEEGG